MRIDTPWTSGARWLGRLALVSAVLMLPRIGASQALTGMLIATVKDADGGLLVGARGTLTSRALVGGPATAVSSDVGQLRFPTLAPGMYTVDIELRGFTPYHEEGVRIGAGGTIERTVLLGLAGLAESVVVEGAGARIDARDPGLSTRVERDVQAAIPTRRTSMFD